MNNRIAKWLLALAFVAMFLMFNHRLSTPKCHRKPKIVIDNLLYLRTDIVPNDLYTKISHFEFTQNRLLKRCIKQQEWNAKLPWIIGITPTYSRMTQVPDLIRLGQTLEQIENFVWIWLRILPTPQTRLIRNITTAAVWPVGHAGGARWSGPICEKEGPVTKYHTNWAQTRRFPVDMAGFGVNLKFLTKHQVYFKHETRHGYLENQFLIDLLNDSLAFIPPNLCKHIFVWHTRTEKPRMAIKGELEMEKSNIDRHLDVVDM
ncbi:Galactosylgalactosylxylosylprotein 3-beta-glucuronosyltransferase 3 [Thelohanellus kitauei]|uniref:Galactosylgalactosylxylosylprotein 3-beta-glucuronosyltransferase n=1 Tax=Thelohanellus kitauei TaxID=669202 RepID=A0A0C2MWV8_THEKT|nr:Galactosylgalactosylxylosylprotein 3-beta-glucuronosyltransferase 3 [Thelohanellus kitauei]